jgi:MEDS: MEthanogen/methylotroph, DcmR Sensory domain
LINSSPARAEQSYRHEAFLWHDRTDFTDGLVPFIVEGLSAGEPVMVATVPEHTEWLREELGQDADRVSFVDMAELGRNPAKILPAWQKFLDTEAVDGRPARGVGEPIWAGRGTDELIECQLHEALLNVAVDPMTPFWLVCPYDAERLDPVVIDEAYRSHPVVIEADAYKGSTQYAGRAHLEQMLGSELPPLAGEPTTIPFNAKNIDRLPRFLKLEGHVAGLALHQASGLASATHGLATGSLQRGATGGIIRMWRQPREVIYEVIDDTYVDDPLAGRRAPVVDSADALWTANQLCDLVQLRSTPAGTIVRLHAYRCPTPTPPIVGNSR